MLDTDTKRRIDSARDILVGKVPNPQSQVEQITIALIYKFMDDMDAESEEFGGNRKFFAHEFARYGWAKLMHSGLGGYETLNLYAEAIAKMTENPGIPLLFRDIFKNAYLPYRDPETLKMFLKVIDEFTYDHSERLGDAFEYLLSVLGSQGDAGQFRTPRHIIDFMVKVIDPKKTETVLDPACGTAGFLIASYKHILKANTDAQGNSTLSPDEKGRLAQNFKGYDISPDMVRLSLVNLYLHGFADPHIYEYDTLASQERWNDYADVILANPPFMSPKGGVMPHKRFSVQSKRSEVLFVDYMAEHLTPSGRAAIIVPEGIIFQSGGAYKQLRKYLVEGNYLWAVASLPSGVFNPYAGVKTSILFLDRALAKKTDQILFVKIEADGFDLGAQRRPVERNDLPAALNVLADWQTAVRNGKPADFDPQTRNGNALPVTKGRLAENGEFNLSPDRYRENTRNIQQVYPMVALGEVTEIEKGTSITKTQVSDGNVPVIAGGQQPAYFHNMANRDGNIITVSSSGAYAGFLNYFSSSIFASDCTTIKSSDETKITTYFLYLLLKNKQADFYALQKGMGQPHVYSKDFRNFQIPLPPLDVQRAIVAEIEACQRIIDGARTVLDNYRPHILIDADWPMVKLGELCAVKSGGTPARSNDSFWNGNIPWVTTTLINFGVIEAANEYITEEGLNNSSTWIVPKGTVLMAMYGQGVTRGRVAVLGIDAAINQACAVFQLKAETLTPGYLFRILQSRYEDLRRISDSRGGNQSNLSAQILKDYSIPLPPLTTQQAIVAEIDAEQVLVNANCELIERFEKKIRATLNRV